MGSQSRRTRKGDRSRKDPSYKVKEAQEIARLEEKRRKTNEYKRQSRARIRASLLEASSTPPTGETSMAPLGAPIVHSPPLASPSSLPVSLIPFPRPPIAPSPIGAHGMASSTAVADVGTPDNMGFLGVASYYEHVSTIPIGGVALSLSPSHVMDELTPPTIGSAGHVHMGSSYSEHTPMISAPSSYVSSPLSPVDDHTPGFLEHVHMVTSPTQHQLSPGYARHATSSFGGGHDHSPPIPQEAGGGSSPPMQGIPGASPSSVAHPTLRSLTRSGVIYRARRIGERFFADIEIQSRTQVLDALLRLPLLRDSRVAAQIWSPRSRRAGAAVIDSVRRSYMTLSRRGSRDALAARRTLTAAVSSDDMTGISRTTSRMLSIRRCTLRDGSRRRQRLDLGHGGDLWASSGRAPRSTRVLDPRMREFIGQFWEHNSRALPDYKKALRHRVGRKQYIEHGACIIEMTQSQLYSLFQQRHPEISIGQRSFEACKPWFIRFMRERDTCCCRYHVEFQLLYDSFRRLHGYDGLVPVSPRDFIHSLLCGREDGDSYHQLACVEGKCAHCGGLAKFPALDLVLQEDEVVSWQRYEYHIYTGQSGASSRRLQLTPHSGPRLAFVSSFRAAIYPYIAHAHGAKWQDRQFRACLASFPIGVVVSVVDFAENYTFAPQQEIQSEYYFSEQV